MNVCQFCKQAGDIVTFWKKEEKTRGPLLNEEDWENIAYIHAECPGKEFCFCQHKLGSVIAQQIPD